MAAGDNQKLKMLYLVRILSEETDEDHALTTQEIITKLKDYGVNAERRTLYKDIDFLEQYGLDIIEEQTGKGYYYHLGSRDFELPELKLLVDAVQSSKFITEKKSRELIKKLGGLASRHDAGRLHRQVVISGRVKTINESIYYNVDLIHEAINAGKQIRFRYYQWNARKERELRKDGASYVVSPWCLMWDDENYYMVAYDAEDGIIKHYRVDKMLEIKISDKARVGEKEFRAFDIAKYSKQVFGMFTGDETDVTLRCENEFAGVFIDRFGKDVFMTPDDDGHFKVVVHVALSNQFLGWVFSLGSGVQVIGPERVIQKMREEAARFAGQYPML
ncbi:MAG: WYL domain-containing transcriptional regulator [Oscillospiraceae bacterium]|nr:WYL domain-containing transcriptional regulator [Oscillospiraceae bacterium]